MDTVFFDASVLFKAAVTRFLFGAAQAGDYRAVWSEAVVEEARRTSSRRIGRWRLPRSSRTSA